MVFEYSSSPSHAQVVLRCPINIQFINSPIWRFPSNCNVNLGASFRVLLVYQQVEFHGLVNSNSPINGFLFIIEEIVIPRDPNVPKV